MNRLTDRNLQILFVLLSFTVLSSSFYFQYIQGLQPCPLCLMQRVCVFVLFLLGLIRILLGTVYHANLLIYLHIIISTAGIFFSSRQLWLQSLSADQTPACLPDLEILTRYFPWRDVLYALFWGAGDCAEVSWRWLGLSMPAWTFFYFAFMWIFGVFMTTSGER